MLVARSGYFFPLLLVERRLCLESCFTRPQRPLEETCFPLLVLLLKEALVATGLEDALGKLSSEAGL